VNWFNIPFEKLRLPGEPASSSAGEPVDPSENPDGTVREPDPDDPPDRL
jgi:hypothetical protein